MCVWSSVFVFVLVCITVCPFPCSNHLEEKDFVFIVSSMSCHFICSVALPHGAMGWSAVCDSGDIITKKAKFNQAIFIIILNNFLDPYPKYNIQSPIRF